MRIGSTWSQPEEHLLGQVLYRVLSGRTTPSGELTQACGLLVTEPVAGTGLCTALWAEWRPQRKPLAAHDPGKVIPDLAANGPAALNAINTTRAVARARAWVTA